MFIIDGHAHIFPDKIAVKASESIGDFYDLPMKYDGTLQTLLNEGDRWGVNMHLVHSVATVPEQVASINNFIAKSVRENPGRLIGFATLHPDLPDMEEEIDRVISLGLKGVKLHPDFQRFYIDEEKMNRLYKGIEGRLPLLVHTGDFRQDFSHPKRIIPVLERFPKLDIICAHFGGWSVWDEAFKHLAGKRLWVDTCSSLTSFSPEKAVELIYGFGEDRVIFGCDYPMWSIGEEIRMIEALELSQQIKEKIFSKNLITLLGLKL